MEKFKTIISWILRISLSVVFAYAAVYKIAYPNEFFTNVSNYQILPKFLAYLAAYFLPALEIVVALALLSDKVLKESLLIIFSMLIVFMLAIASAWFRGLDISCGCFKESEIGNYAEVIIRDLILIAMCIIIYLLKIDKKGRLKIYEKE